MSDVSKELLRVFRVEPTQEQRDQAQGFYNDNGDCFLAWVNEGDFTEATLASAQPAPDVEKVARAICGRGMEWRGCESDCHAAGKCVGTLSECVIDDAKAAITAMRGGE